MPEDQTTQTSEQEATQAAVEAATESQRQTEGVEPTTTEQESIDWQTRHTEATRKITEQGQELANLRAQQQQAEATLGQYQNALSQFGQQAAANQDPVQAAWNRYTELDADYGSEPVQKQAALQQWITARDQQREQEILNKAVAQQRMMNELPQAGTMLGVQDQNALSHQLQGVATSLTPTELALVQLNRSGKLNDFVAGQSAAAEAQRQQAEALQALPGLGGGRGVPGQQASQPIPLPFEEWAQLNPDAKERLRNGDQEIVVTGAPKHFDPNKD